MHALFRDSRTAADWMRPTALAPGLAQGPFQGGYFNPHPIALPSPSQLRSCGPQRGAGAPVLVGCHPVPRCSEGPPVG
ncbi:hypothetical protein GQ53DRAFT_755602 [Thozetella sp. PMI_491]|nr:hypothetical protein GQ53DRAFT_755602 [Thozetella sp. PMI_491]